MPRTDRISVRGFYVLDKKDRIQILTYKIFIMNQEIAAIFNDIAGLLEIKGDSAYRINAYRYYREQNLPA